MRTAEKDSPVAALNLGAGADTFALEAAARTTVQRSTTRQRLGTADLSYPFSALVGQDEMTRSLLLVSIDPGIGGVLVFGDRGTGKSTAVRGLARLLPPMSVLADCAYGCDPNVSVDHWCEDCRQRYTKHLPKLRAAPVPVVDLPLGATEDRVVGALDLQRALSDGVKAFEPGLLARAHRGFLYIDEVNLLEDHLVDLLLDVAATGVNVVEREGLSVRHPARFVLIGSGNPEEGELRPQLLDRFGLSVEVETPRDLKNRIEVVRRRDAYERDPAGFCAQWKREDNRLRRKLMRAREQLDSVIVGDEILELAATLCMALGTDGLRGELTLMRTARALAALKGHSVVTVDDLRAVAPSALRHRLRRNPLDDAGSSARIERAIAEVLPA
jgi:magnesium chelatase subunit I